MKRIKRAPNPARNSGYSGNEVGPAIKAMAQTPIGAATYVALRVIWNKSEADRDKIVATVRRKGLKFGTARDNHAFTFQTETDALNFETELARLTGKKASVYRSLLTDSDMILVSCP